AKFFAKHFGEDGTPVLLAPCIKTAQDALYVKNAVALLEVVSGPEKADRGAGALRVLELPKTTCAQKKAAVEELGNLHYARARTALSKLEKERLAQKQHPSAQFACFGSSIADALAQMK